MTTGLRPYPEYKNPGLPWLGQVPKHWDVRRIKTILREVDRRSSTGTEPLLSMTRQRGLIRHAEATEKMHSARTLVGYKMCQAGEVVMNRMQAWSGMIHVAPEQGLVSPDYAVFAPLNGVNAQFLGYLLRSPMMVAIFRAESRGIGSGFLRLYGDRFGAIHVAVPSVNEQRAMVRFVDAVDREVRQFIRNRRHLIEMLNEQRQAIINRIVTRGLDSDVPLEFSGIDWLGNVPRHWSRVRLKYVASVQTGITLGKNYIGRQVEARPYLRVANVQTGHLDLRVVKTVAVPPSEIIGSELRSGDVLMTEGGDIDKLGRGCVWRGEIEGCLHQNHIFAVRADQSRLVPDYLVALMASRHGRTYFELTAKRTTNLASTNSSTLGAFPLVLPPVEEQKQLLRAIADETRELDVALNRASSEIDLIREYRTRLIADVVTGKLDVGHVSTMAVLVQRTKRKRAANIHFRRSVFAAEIVHRLYHEPTFGHVKFEKLIFLCEKRCGVDTGSTYHRQAAGPYDNRALRSIDSQIKKQQWFAAQKVDNRYQYIPLASAGGHKTYFDRYFANVEGAFSDIIEIFRKLNTRRCEIVATLYAAWEDLLAQSDVVTDDEILEQVLHHWHPSKQQIDENHWRQGLGWMRKKGLTPKGGGQRC